MLIDGNKVDEDYFSDFDINAIGFEVGNLSYLYKNMDLRKYY